MNLEVSIQHLEQRARAVRRASLWGMGIFIACILSALPIQFFELSWVLPVWSGCGTVALLTTMVLTGIYSYRYRPALKRARNDLQLTMIARLQQRVADLSRKLDS